MSIFQIDSPFYDTLRRLTELIILNLLWLIFSVPLITIGASTAAMYAVLMREDKESSTIKRFWRAFWSNLKSSFPLTLIMACLAIIAWIAYLIFLAGDMSKIQISDVPPALLILMFFCVNSYVWPLYAQFENTTGQIIKNALLLALAHFPTSLLMAALNMVPIVWLLYATQSFMKFLMIWLLIGFAAIASLCVRMLKPILLKHMTQEE